MSNSECNNCKRLEQALDVCKLNRDKAESLVREQATTIKDLRDELDLQRGRSGNKGSVNGTIKELGK